MQKSDCRPLLTLRRSHFDSDTYRAVLRILSHCAEAVSTASPSPPRLLPSPTCEKETERSASSEGAGALGGIPGEGGCGLVFPGNGDEQQCAGLGAPEDATCGVGMLPDATVARCPEVDDAHGGNSPLGEGLGGREGGEEVCDESGNVVSREDQSGGINGLLMEDFSVDFSGLMKELGLLEEDGAGNDEPDSDGFEKKLQSEGAVLLGLSEASAQVDAPENGEERQGSICVDESIDDALPIGGQLPTEFVCEESELLPAASENRHLMDESCKEAQLKVYDSSGLSTTGSGLELGEHQKNIAVCASVEHDMEEGEIPNEGEFSDFSFGLESQDAPNGVQLEEIYVADDSVEKGDVTHVVSASTSKRVSSGADIVKDELKRPVHESEQLTGRVEVKPQKKKTGSKGTRKVEGNSQKKVDVADKLPSNQMGLEYEKKKSNVIAIKDAISENITSRSSSLSEIGLKASAIPSEEVTSNTEDVKVQQKRKKGPLTENRKEKKKLAKKRKRAETNKKLGVKRLKLEMVSKPKKVIFCSFYQKGRCQKGDSCKFSHDFIPDTKSMPCTFFARGTCLKGDDCPFDHQLSKYPCHSYMSQGRCNRGDSCLFSHKIPAGDLSSKTSVASETDSKALSAKQSPQKCLHLSKTDSKTLSEKQSLQRCLNSAGLSSSAVKTSMEITATTSAKSSMPKDSMEQTKFKQPVRMPKGISFLSFGKEPSIKKQNHDLDLKKDVSIQVQKAEEKVISGKLQNSNENVPDKSLSCRTLTSPVNEDRSSCLLQKLCLLPQQNVEIMPSKSIQPLGSGNTSSNVEKDLNNEERRVTNASRILEEFLFSGID